jgi:ABC-2 type transport system ATP-binding protein
MDHTLEVTVDRHEALNGLFERLSAKGIAVSSMRNKANRLEELFVASAAPQQGGGAA